MTPAAVRTGSKMAPLGSTLLLVRGSALHSEIRASLVTAPVCFNQDVKALVPDARVHPRFLTHSLRANSERLLKLVTSAGNTAGVLDTAVTQRLSIWLPTREVQTAIVETLDDVESLISTLERLIAKKQAIKQGMMQQLLTGQTRLPGYSASWVNVTACDVGAFKGGSGFPIKYQGSRTGEYPFFKVSDMNNHGNELFMRFARHYVGESRRKQIGAVVMPKDAVVFAKVGAAVFLERKRILSQPSCIDNNMAAFILNSLQADVRFVHYSLMNFAMSSLVATTALPSLNGGQLRSIPLALPKELREQRAIAAVLGDADSELSALATRLTKAKAIKQGMMQELLTGRTRLPIKEVTS